MEERQYDATTTETKGITTTVETALERPKPMPAGVARHTSLLLLKVSGWIQGELDRVLEDVMGAPGLKSRHYSVVSVLNYQGVMSQQALGQKLRIDRATMVAIVDDLERFGLVVRQRDTNDRRLYQLHITDDGKTLVPHVQEAVAGLEDRLFAPLSPDERTNLHESLVRLLAPSAPPPM